MQALADVYLDNAATTPLWPEVQAWLGQPWPFGNPSSSHAQGRKAKALLQKARSWVAEDLDVEPQWVVFTASATESDNLAILGTAAACAKEHSGQPLHFLCSAFEHPAVQEPLRFLASQGHELEMVRPEPNQGWRAQDLLAKLRPNTALVSVMAVHNELGLRLGVQEVGAALKHHAARLHCDGVQAIATQALSMRDWNIDLLTLTAHKIGGPKGVGVLVRDPSLALEPLCRGGGQEAALRPGTENPSMAFAFALALRTTIERRELRCALYQSMGDALVSGMRALVPGLVAMRERHPCAHNIVTLCIPGHKGRDLVAALDARGIGASAGAACHAGDDGAPSAAQLLGLEPALARGTLRLSFGPRSEPQDVQTLLAAMAEILS